MTVEGNVSSLVGRRLGRYQIQELLGAGGMGAVYRARDTSLGRDVAIKVPAATTDDEIAGRQLMHEARAAAALDHPNICTIHEVAEADRRWFIVMQHVEGETVAARMAKRRLSSQQVVAVATEVAGALAYAHRRGIVHRDIKPQNIMLTSTEHVKVLDFGLARITPSAGDERSTIAALSVSDAVAGTVPYMSPEQLRGEPLDGRSDIFSFGTLLYELANGEHPFAGSTAADTIAAILMREPRTIAEPQLVPPVLRRVLRKCLEKDKSQRYQSMDEVVADLVRDDRPGQLRAFDDLASAGAPLPLPPAIGGVTSATGFIGRDGELSTMTAAWERATQGSLALILVGGDPGIGKTRLCTEFARTCFEQGGTVLVGRCDEQTLVPYQPFVEALTWYSRTCPEPDLLAHLSAAGGGAELGSFIPDLARRVPDLPRPGLMNPEGQRFRLLETVSALLAAVSASRPTLVVFEDLHWADQPTLLMLRHLVRSATPARLCVLGTFREAEVDSTHPLAATLADLRREGNVTRLSLGGLGRDGVRGILESVAGGKAPPQLVELMTESTGGNPFFVGEMSRHLLETGALTLERAAGDSRTARIGLPEGVKDVLRQRLSRLSADCNTALRLAAVVGQEFGVEILEALGDLPEDRLLDAIDEAVHARLIEEAHPLPGRFGFVHALIRETLYGDLSALRRARLHRRVGEALEQLTGARPNPPYADLAHHFVRSASADTADKAIEYATRAGDRAVEGLAHEEAAQLYALALQSLERKDAGADADAVRADLHARRGRAFGALGQWALQKAELDRALQCLEATERERRGELLLQLSEASFFLLDIPAVERLAAATLELADQVHREDLGADAIAWLARARQAQGELDAAIDMDRVAMRRSNGHSRVAVTHAGLSLYLAGRSSEAVIDGEHAVEVARASNDASQIMYALPHFGLVLGSVGRYADAGRVFDEVREFGRRFGVLPPLARATAMAAGHHLGVFDFDGARVLQLEARELARSLGFAPTIVSASIDLLLIAARTHDPGSAEQLLQQTSEDAARMPGWHGWLWSLRLCQVRAELALARDEYESAVQEATQSIDRSRARGRPKYEALGLITRAHAMQRVGRTQHAIADLRRAATVARGVGDPALLLQAIAASIAIEADDALLTEAQALIARISDALPNTMRLSFDRSEPVQQVRRFVV
jgi:tetratricopeptide (TPR) repeat protein